MTNIRFPLKLPTSGHPNPYTIDFDFLPNNPFSLQLAPINEPYIYTTKIIFNDTSIETKRIEHVFPEGKVYFVSSNENNSIFENMGILTDKILNNTLENSFKGIWIQSGSIRSIKSIKNNPLMKSPFTPVSIIYNSVIITPSLIQQILNIIEGITFKFNPQTENEDTIKADNPIARAIIVGHWLKGKIGINVKESNILNNSILLPLSANVNQIQIGAISADNNGIEYRSMQGLINLLNTNLENNKLFNIDTKIFINDSKKFRINPIPLNQFLEDVSGTTLMSNEIKTHPYRLEYNKYFNQIKWNCIVFNFGSLRQLSTTSIAFFENKLLRDKLLKIKIDNDIFPIESTGVFYYPDLHGKQIQIFQNDADLPLNLFIFFNQNIISGTSITLIEEYKKQNYYQVGIGVSPSEIFENISDKYFNISTDSLNNFIPLLEKLTISCGNLLTAAECFARAMGFIAEAVKNELVRILGNNVKVSFIHFKVFILTAYEIFFDEINKDELLNEMLNKLGEYIKMDADFFLKLMSINLQYRTDPKKYDWLKTHGDHNFSDSSEGWKSFGLDNDGGHKHHFIANAMVYIFAEYKVPILDVVENFDFFGIEDVEIDRMYNEKGREFASWSTGFLDFNSPYHPELVYSKIKELIVENEFIQ